MPDRVVVPPSSLPDPHITLARKVIALACCVSLVGCAGTTLFQSDFARYPPHWPPIGNQKVGTAEVDPVSDQYVSSGGPTGWVRISREDSQPVPRAALLCHLSEFKGDGTYVFSTVLSMRSGTGAATIQFEPFNQPVTNYGGGFLHLDLMPDNSVRVDDNDATKFGTFPRDQEFVLQVTLKIDSTPRAHILLSGAGASGEAEYAILPAYVPLARQFGSVRLWMAAPWPGFFDAANIVVKRN